MSSEPTHPFLDLLSRDRRYKLEAYQFVKDALNYAQEVLQMGEQRGKSAREERHLTGQQLCEALRQLSLEQFGYMSKTVLNSWGLHSTSDIGEIVYNLIDIGMMKKSPQDRREHFDNVYDFDVAFRQQFQIDLHE